MRDFYQEALSEIKLNLVGLPSFCRLVVYDLLKYCDYQAGTISIKTLEEAASNDFYVAPCNGRKKEVITADSLRNAFRTIKKAKPDHFIFKNVNQRIVIEMPFIRELYQSFYGQPSEVAADLSEDVATEQTYAQTSGKACFEPLLAEYDVRDLAAASLNPAINVREHACAKIKPNFKPNNNSKPSVSELLGDGKKTIRDDFQPSQAMIDNALRLGLSKVMDSSELNKFIIFNKSSGSRWANWDYVYLNWLIRDVEREQAKAIAKRQQPKQTIVYSRRYINERNCHTVKSGKPTMEDVLYANRDAVAPWECIQYEPLGNVITTDDFMVVG